MKKPRLRQSRKLPQLALLRINIRHGYRLMGQADCHAATPGCGLLLHPADRLSRVSFTQARSEDKNAACRVALTEDHFLAREAPLSRDRKYRGPFGH
jgi:hypothetical protein